MYELYSKFHRQKAVKKEKEKKEKTFPSFSMPPFVKAVKFLYFICIYIYIFYFYFLCFLCFHLRNWRRVAPLTCGQLFVFFYHLVLDPRPITVSHISMIDQNLGTISINQKYILIYILTRDTIRSRQNTRYIGDCDLEITPKWISESQSLWLIIKKKL